MAGYSSAPSLRTPRRSARVKSASVQLPIPVAVSWVMFGP